MMTSERMLEIYSGLKEVIARRKTASVYTSLGYTSNLDLIPEFTSEDLNRLLAAYLPDACLREMRPAGLIRNMPQLLETIVYYCLHGIGAEADIEDLDLIRTGFPCRNAMGGTAVQAALALDRLGACSVVHLSDDSKEVRKQLISPNIKVPVQGGSLGGAGDAAGGNYPETHVIIQFQKGSRICLGNQVETIPASNRLILTRNTVNAFLPLDENYLDWVETHAQQVSSNVLSSFNSILDPEVLKREFGRDITFWGGGCNTRAVLNHASPAEVYDHCRRRIEIFGEGGGFVFNQEHNILPDVPPENILAMYKAVADAGR